MRVLFFSWRDTVHPRAGGSEVFIDRLAQGLIDRGHSATVVAGGPVTSHPYPVYDGGGTYSQYLRGPYNYRRWAGEADVVVDVVNGMAPLTPLWSRRPVLCMVHHVHTEQWAEHFGPTVSRVGRNLEVGALTRVYRHSLFSALSPSTATSLEAIGVDRRQIRVVPAGVELPPDPGIGYETDEPTFLALGRLVPHKRIDLLLRVWERVRPHTGGRLIIAGDGPERSRLEAQAGTGVDFLGEVSADHKEALLRDSWLLLHPAEREGWGLVILEAAGYRTPALGFRVPGVQDAIQHEQSGLLAADESEFGAYWASIATEPEWRTRLGKGARVAAAELTWANAVERFDALLNEAIDDHRARSLTSIGRGSKSDPHLSPIVTSTPREVAPAQAEPTNLDLSIVIPSYNEETRLPLTLDAIAEHPALTGAEVIVVDDGSTDATSTVATRRLSRLEHGRLVQLTENKGKGAAVRAGVAAAVGRRILYMDADLATDLSGIGDLLGALDDAEVAVGSRALPTSTTDNATRLRAVMGRSWNRLIRYASNLDLHDTQCGFKAFRADAAKLLFHLSNVDRFAFDVEILALADHLGMRIQEVPVDWRAVDGSKVRPLTDSLATAVDLRRATRVKVRHSVSGIALRTARQRDALPINALLCERDGQIIALLPGWDRVDLDSLAARCQTADPSAPVRLCTAPPSSLTAALIQSDGRAR